MEKYYFNFHIDEKNKINKDLTSIYIRFNLDSSITKNKFQKTIKFIKIPHNQWNYELNRLKRNASNETTNNIIANINEELTNYLSNVETHLFSIHEIERLIELHNPKHNNNRILLYDSKISSILETNLDFTIYNKAKKRNYRTALNHIKNFELKQFETNKQEFKVKNIDGTFINKFCSYLLEKVSTDKSMKTIITNVRTIIKACVEDENIRSYIGENRTVRIKKNVKRLFPIIPINMWDEIYNLTFENKYVEATKLWMIIGLHIGTRVGDLLRLNPSNFRLNLEKEHLIIKETQKTKVLVKVPMWGLLHQYIEDYKDNQGNILLPLSICDKTFNKHLKEVYKKVDENSIFEFGGKNDFKKNRKLVLGNYFTYELISSHSLRRSFATELYKYDNTRLRLIMFLTGHKSIKSLLAYINITDEEQFEEATDFLNTIDVKKLSRKKEANY